MVTKNKILRAYSCSILKRTLITLFPLRGLVIKNQILSLILLFFIPAIIHAGGITVSEGKLTLQDGIITLSSMTITSTGEFDLTGGTIQVKAKWSNSGNFSHTDGEVSFIDNTITAILEGNTTFYRFNCTTADKTIAFTAGSTQTIKSGGTFNVQGQTDHRVNLISTSSPNQWYLGLYANQNVSEVSATDSYVYSADNSGYDVVLGVGTCDETNSRWWVTAVPGAPLWQSPYNAIGYTLNNRPKLWFSAPGGEISYTNAVITLATDSGFTQNVHISNYTAPDGDTWDGWTEATPDDYINPSQISTYTVSVANALTRETSWYAKVRFSDGFNWGDESTTLEFKIEAATNTFFTDTVITYGVSPIKALHFTELQACIKELRKFRGLTEGTWTDFDNGSTGAAAGNPIRAAHINELRTNLNGVLATIDDSQSWSETITGGVTKIRKIHLEELRENCAKP